MPLIACPDCAAQVSTAAPVCPQCGRPTTSTATPGRKIQTVEATSKKWKLLALLSFLTFLGSVLLLVIGANIETPAMIAIGILGIIAAVIGGIVARFGAWWFHG